MTKTRESIIDRIQKLLAVAAPDSGATVAEREQAQRRAAEMMTKHDLASYDIEDADRGGIGDDTIAVDGMTEKWRGELAGRIASAMGGDWYLTRVSRVRTRYTIVGRPDTIAFARALTDHLIPWLEVECDGALAKALADPDAHGICSRCDGAGETRRLVGGGYTDDEHECPTCGGSGQVPLSARVFRREFYDAAGRKIAGRLAAQRRKTADAERGKGTGTELVRSDKAAIDRFYESHGLEFRTSRNGTTGGALAGRAAGHDAGSRASLTGGAVTKGRGALPKGGA